MAEDQDTFVEGEGEDEGRGIRDTFKKAINSGIRSVMGSEEWVRSTVKEAFPRELVSYMKRQADTARDEVVRIIGAQTKRFLEGIDVGGEIQKILTALSFEVKTEVRFIPNDQKVKPDIKVTARTKRTDRDKEKSKGKGKGKES